MLSKCNAVFFLAPDLSKAKKQFEQKNCEKALRYVLGKFTTNQEENQIINNVKNTNPQVKSIFEVEEFKSKNCEWAIRHVLAEEGCSKSNIDDIMLKVAPLWLDSNSEPSL